MEDLRVLFFFYIIQGLLMVIAGVQFFDLKINNKQIIAVGACYGLVIWLVRGVYSYYSIPLGTHTIVLAILFCIIIKIITKTPVYYAVGISLMSFCLVMLGVGVVAFAIKLNSLNLEQIMSNIWLNILFGHIENSILIIFMVVSRLLKFNISNINRG